MDDLIERLQAGCVYRPKRWSGDTHDDLGGSIDEAATESLLAEAAEALEAARKDAERYRFIAADKSPAWEEELNAAIDAAREARND